MEQFVVAVFRDDTGYFPQSSVAGKFPTTNDAEWIFSVTGESFQDAWDKAAIEADTRGLKVPSLNFNGTEDLILLV